MIIQIYQPEPLLNKSNISDTEVPCLDLHRSILNSSVASKHYDTGDDFDSDISHFPFSGGYVPRRSSYRVYTSQLIRFASL